MKFLLLLFASTLACVAAIAAPDEPKTYEIRVAAVDIVGDHNILWMRTGTGKEAVRVDLNTRVFSASFKYKGPAEARFYTSEVEAMAEEPPEPIAKVKLLARSSLILFLPEVGADSKSYQTYSVEESRFPYGSFRFINFSKSKVRVEMDGKKTEILSRKSANFTFPAGNNSVAVSIIAMSAKTGKPRYTRSSIWSIAANQRELILLFPNPRNGLVQAKHFVDSKLE